MSDYFIGEIRMFAGDFAPSQWALCTGNLLPISQNQALFTLIGTTYGGDGIQTFGLPNLQGRIPIGQGQGPALANYIIGTPGGTEDVPILQSNLPNHGHSMNASSASATSQTVGSTIMPAKPNTAGNTFFTIQGSPPVTMEHLSGGSCGLQGGNTPHSNLMPTLCITFIIALSGIFPSRN